jgi:16S rRNA (guanine1516-N2)-methyltransferase
MGPLQCRRVDAVRRIVVRTEERPAEARRLAAEMGLPIADGTVPDGGDLILAFHDGRLELRRAQDRPGTGTGADPAEVVRRAWRGGTGLSRRQPLARAIGRRGARVVDATAGLGGDSVLLALLGCDVTAIERSPVIAALLRDGLARAMADPRCHAAIGDRVRVVTGDARRVVIAIHPPPDVVYLDPMFPPKRKRSALARKEIRTLREIVGDDPDAADLLATALRAATDRVVVKRPTFAPPLAGEPTMSFGGKIARYDVYRSAPRADQPDR